MEPNTFQLVYTNNNINLKIHLFVDFFKCIFTFLCINIKKTEKNLIKILICIILVKK